MREKCLLEAGKTEPQPVKTRDHDVAMTMIFLGVLVILCN